MEQLRDSSGVEQQLHDEGSSSCNGGFVCEVVEKERGARGEYGWLWVRGVRGKSVRRVDGPWNNSNSCAIAAEEQQQGCCGGEEEGAEGEEEGEGERWLEKMKESSSKWLLECLSRARGRVKEEGKEEGENLDYFIEVVLGA